MIHPSRSHGTMMKIPHTGLCIFGTKFPIANILGNNRPLTHQIYKELEDEGHHNVSSHPTVPNVIPNAYLF